MKGEMNITQIFDESPLPIKDISGELKDLIYSVDGMCECFRAENYGEAKDWIRHVNDAYTEYQESIDK